MELRQLEYFIASVEEKSFYKASEKLYVSQPAISKSIARLENDLKGALFIRGNKGLQLTPKGEKIYQQAKKILYQVEILKTDESNKNECLRISSYPSKLIADVLADFYNGYHSVFEIDYREGSIQDVIDNVNTGISEVGMIYISPTQKEIFTHILSHNNLEFVPILENELCIYIGKKHEKYGMRESVSSDEIADYKYIRGLRDYFSAEHHFDYVNLNEINTFKFQDTILTNSDHLVNVMLEKTDLCYLGIETKKMNIDSKISINSNNKKVVVGYVKNKSSKVESITYDFLKTLSKLL